MAASFGLARRIWLARRIGVVDHPGIRSVHTRPIPRIGGVAIYLFFATSIGIFLATIARLRGGDA